MIYKDYKEIIDSFTKKIYLPVYLLMGENTYLIDKISNYVQHNFFEDEDIKDFNLQVLYGKDSTPEQIVFLAKQFPMMSDYRVVLVKEAQSLPHIEEMASYIQNPQKQTILILCHKYKTIDKRTSFYKSIEKVGGVFDSPKVWDNQVPGYVKQIVAEYNFTIDNHTSELIASHIGTDLSRIDSEINKFNNIISPGGKITLELVEEHIGISKEYNVFELSNAILMRQEQKAFEIIHYLYNTVKTTGIPILPPLYASFLKMIHYHYSTNKQNLNAIGVTSISAQNAFKQGVRNYNLRQLILITRFFKEYDLKTKGYEGVSITEEEVLKELVYKIFHC